MSVENPISPEALGEKQPREKIVRSEKALSDYLEDNSSTALNSKEVKRELLGAIKADVSDLIKGNEVFREAIKNKKIRKDTAKKVIIGEITHRTTVAEEEKQNFYELLGEIYPESERDAERIVSYKTGYEEGSARLERMAPPTESSLFPRSTQLRFRKLDFQPPG